MSVLFPSLLQVDELLVNVLRRNEKRSEGSVPRMDEFEQAALANVADEIQQWTNDQLTLRHESFFGESFLWRCARIKEARIPLSCPKEYKRSLTSLKKLYMKAACAAVLVREKMTRLLYHESIGVYMADSISFLVNECGMNLQDVQNDHCLLYFTWAVQTALSMGLKKNRNSGLYVQIGVFLEGSGNYYVRGGEKLKAVGLRKREDIVDQLLAEPQQHQINALPAVAAIVPPLPVFVPVTDISTSILPPQKHSIATVDTHPDLLIRHSTSNIEPNDITDIAGDLEVACQGLENIFADEITPYVPEARPVLRYVHDNGLQSIAPEDIEECTSASKKRRRSEEEENTVSASAAKPPRLESLNQISSFISHSADSMLGELPKTSVAAENAECLDENIFQVDDDWSFLDGLISDFLPYITSDSM